MNNLVNLFEKDYKFYFSIVLLITQNIADTQDVLQIAFLNAFTSNYSHINNDDLKKWFVTVCKNTAITYINKRKNDMIREEKHFINKEIKQNFEDELIIDILVHKELNSIPNELKKHFYEYIFYGTPIQVICNKNKISRDKMRYWKDKLQSQFIINGILNYEKGGN